MATGRHCGHSAPGGLRSVRNLLQCLVRIPAPLIGAEQFAFVANLMYPIERPALVLALDDPECTAIMVTIEGLRFLDARPPAISPGEKSLFQPNAFFFLPAAIVFLLLVPQPFLFALYVLLQRSNDRAHLSALRLLCVVERKTAILQVTLWIRCVGLLPNRAEALLDIGFRQ